MIYKVLGALIIGAAAALAFLTLKEDFGITTKTKSKTAEACVQLTPAQQLNKLINDDFQELANTQQLPVEWGSIATVEIRMNSELAKAILGKSRPHVQRVKEGTAFLELEVMDLPDEENPGVIIQASLFDIKSKNKIFEIGRTYTMNDLNKITPPPAATPPAKEGAPVEDSKSNATATNANPAAAVPGAAANGQANPAGTATTPVNNNPQDNSKPASNTQPAPSQAPRQ